MRVLILGAGVVGAMTAWRLAQAGHDVHVFEQFGLDHDRGSSYGDSRVVRRVYSDPFYTALMADAYPLWQEFQEQSSEELFSVVGGIMFGPSDLPDMRDAEVALEESAVPYERLNASQAALRYPALKLHDNEVALFEPSMGYARASHCVRAAVSLARASGATFHFETPIDSVEPARGGGCEVTTRSGEVFSGDRMLISAGPWAGGLLGRLGVDIPVQVVRKTYLHLQPERSAADFEVGHFPVWIDASSLAYGFPRLGDVPGVKIALHGGGEPTSPDEVRRELNDVDRQALLEYAAVRFPDLSSEIVYEKVCLYTNTPDEDFIVDEVRGLPGAFFIAGLSGHGFKFGPLLGSIATALLTGDAQPYDLSRFSLSRFASD
jgi:sarcosine oxidase